MDVYTDGEYNNLLERGIMKTHKGKQYAWVNEELISGVYHTMWRCITDPTDMLVGELTVKNKKEKINELKDLNAKVEWQKVKDKKPIEAVK